MMGMGLSRRNKMAVIRETQGNDGQVSEMWVLYE